MHDLTSFGLDVFLVAAALSAALLASKLSARIAVPSAALFLVAAALASDAASSLAPSTRAVERIGTVALIVILFDGGSSIGLRRFRSVAARSRSLGIGRHVRHRRVDRALRHWALGLGWIMCGLLGAAIAPTDPAVMFSVLGDRAIGGRVRPLLEGESGANDPVGIALMIGMIELATQPGSTFWSSSRRSSSRWHRPRVRDRRRSRRAQVLRKLALPSSGLHTVRMLALAGLVYGAASSHTAPGSWRCSSPGSCR